MAESDIYHKEIQKKRKQRLLVEGFCPKCNIDNPLHHVQPIYKCYNPKCQVKHCDKHLRLVKCNESTCSSFVESCPGMCYSSDWKRIKAPRFWCSFHSFRCKFCGEYCLEKGECNGSKVWIVASKLETFISKSSRANTARCSKCNRYHVQPTSNERDNIFVTEITSACSRSCKSLYLNSL